MPSILRNKFLSQFRHLNKTILYLATLYLFRTAILKHCRKSSPDGARMHFCTVPSQVRIKPLSSHINCSSFELSWPMFGVVVIVRPRTQVVLWVRRGWVHVYELSSNMSSRRTDREFVLVLAHSVASLLPASVVTSYWRCLRLHWGERARDGWSYSLRDRTVRRSVIRLSVDSLKENRLSIIRQCQTVARYNRLGLVGRRSRLSRSVSVCS